MIVNAGTDYIKMKQRIAELERELAARNEQLIVATKLADSRYNELQELWNLYEKAMEAQS